MMMRARLQLRWLKRNSLLWRLLLIGIAALAPLSAALVQFAGNERRMAVNATRERAEMLVSYAVDRHMHMLEEARVALGFLSDSPEVRSAGPQCSAFLQRYVTMHQWIGSLRLSKPDGSEACSDGKAARSPNPAEQEFFIKAARQLQFILSGPTAAHDIDALQMTAAAPVYNGDQFVGVISARMAPGVFGSQQPAPLGSNLDATILVLDRKGHLIAHQPPLPELVGTNVGDRLLVQEALMASRKEANIADLTGVSRIFVFRDLPETDMVLAIGLNQSSVVGAIDHALRYRLVLIILIISGSLLLAMLGVEWLILRPLRMLAGTAEALEQGDFSIHSPYRGFGEVRLLERAFTRMAKAVADRERDLTSARDVAEKALSQANSASMAKTNFLASMSHEIRTPLNGIIGYTEQLLNEPLHPRQRRYIDLIQVSASALLTVANDILEFSSIEAEQIKLRLEPFSLVALVDNTVSIVSSGAGKKGVPVKVVLDPSIPKMFIGDEARLRQILLNLLNNAVKFTREGHIAVMVEHQGNTDEGEHIRIEVADTGIGIAPEKHDRLFRRFSQVDPTIRREFGGTGLGLAISKRLIELMGGRIGVESQLGKGSTFWVELVLPSTASLPGEPVENAVPVAAIPARILVVEDVEINQELVKILLEAAGHRVDIVSSGEEAIMAVQGPAYDLVLMDIQMPGMDGITATKMIRALHHPAGRTFIAAMTANVLPQQVRSFMEAGFNDHIGKPIRRDLLLRKLDEWLPPAAGSGHTGERASASDSFEERNFKDFIDLMGHDRVGLWLARLEEKLKNSFPDNSNLEGNLQQIAQDAHAITSQAALLGFSRLAELCTRLEQACLLGRDVMPLLEAIRREARTTCETIARISKSAA
jgi:signal transduction histidine kinase/CheY-like chemotaxis protein/HPt (histidine-containing phosphotransfer) domain-containing protein